ncbi:STAS domain-containing protein [Mycobacterium sp. 236(2023)]|nr:STAS domain-containing protein [Mycobacterium sp. 236(2023)]MDG4669424.1 STAS domain-containing protein [Mycobacterium sp. 236(2023)]
MVQSAGSPHGGGLTFSSEVGSETVVLRVSGAVDMLTAPTFTQYVDSVLDTTLSGLIIDLTEVSFLASAGLEALVKAQRKAGESTALIVVAAGPATRRPITLTAVDRDVRVCTTIGEAHAVLDNR